ncbi:MAG: hypothetical protein GFH27_549309n79 [Chloroflexi bacterium AL-W]|nr:hypothetical protein [Chloroflexi bacterium AL-N1]NOK69782.1 hypothetical protein [Chloroflexi bacterium AL-N10]NOK73614.1 hypothetical protein [Chloroflexi bacterium AL-N5]NOK83952.1 hypothetical protein [Chloroflexi bacterium AL-W]NOK87945.1 hypothetical protein [Chloroflexi bacterium AL-N15]
MHLQRVSPSLAKLKATVAHFRGVNPMIMTISFILFATILGVAGQLLLKQGMSQMGTLDISAMGVPMIAWRMATSPFVIGGLLVYASGTFFWLLVLNRVPLSYSYPFISLGIVLGTLSAWGIFREDIPPMRWVGLMVVCVGVIIVGMTN